MVAELAFPSLFLFIITLLANDTSLRLHYFNHTVNVENSVAFEASNRVTGRNLGIVLKGFELNLEDIRVYLLPEPSSFSIVVDSFFLGFRLHSELLDIAVVLLSREIKISVKLIRVNVFARPDILLRVYPI